MDPHLEATGSLVAPLVFKASVGLNKVPGGFDSHSPPLKIGWQLGGGHARPGRYLL